MTEREKRIREHIARLTRPTCGVSREFSLLSVDDTEFLLDELARARSSVSLAGRWADDWFLKGTTA